MVYKCTYKTPSGFGDMVMNSDGKYLTALCFEHSRDISKFNENGHEKNIPVFERTKKWLDIYFAGKIPDFVPKYKIENLTPFRSAVIDIMNKIPYGTTVTYNDIAKQIAASRNIKKMSAQAVGGAVGWNPICIIIPCHRVVGTSGDLIGYGGEIQNKIKLLELEGNDMSKFTYNKMKGRLK